MQYMAIATYTGSASSKTADGYITTAVYSGEVVSSGIASIEYTVTYVGEPVSAPEPEPEQKPASDNDAISYVWYFVGAGIIILLAAGTCAFLLLRKNTKVYTLTESGDEYEPIGKVSLSARNLTIDLLSFGKYPDTQAVVEVNNRTARRLFGRLVKIRLRGGTVTHRIEQSGNDSYWFTVSTIEEEAAE